ncbi:MAG TPA: hypothetical protein VF219_02055 [Vicinamibacterales bacterium]
MKPVVVVQPEVRDEGVGRRGPELDPSGLEVRTFDSAHGPAAGSLNDAADLPVGFGYEQPHQQLALVGMAPDPNQLQDCCHALEVSAGAEFLRGFRTNGAAQYERN